MDPELPEVELDRCAGQGKLPKAVAPTDLYGQCCKYDRIFAVCERYGVPVVLDAAEAMGARYIAGDSGGIGRGDSVDQKYAPPVSRQGFTYESQTGWAGPELSVVADNYSLYVGDHFSKLQHRSVNQDDSCFDHSLF